jgi:hypothetical protein
MAHIAYMFTTVGPGARHRAGRHALGARTAGQGDERDLALAGGDRLGRVGDMDHVGRAAGIGGVHMARLQPHVLDHRHRSETGRVAGAEVAVDIVLGEARVLERPLGDLRVELRQRDVLRQARRVFVDAGYVGLTLDAHRRPISLLELRRMVGECGSWKSDIFRPEEPC